MSDLPSSKPAGASVGAEPLTESELASPRDDASVASTLDPFARTVTGTPSVAVVGAADPAAPPQSATGHYGPGYGDPTVHYGNTVPAQPNIEAAAQSGSAQSGSAHRAAPEGGSVAVSSPTPLTGLPAAPALIQGASSSNVPSAPPATEADASGTSGARPGTQETGLESEDVGFRPPDHLQEDEVPASENASLIFERS